MLESLLDKTHKKLHRFLQKLLFMFIPSRSRRQGIKMALNWPGGVNDFKAKKQALLKAPKKNFKYFLSVVAIAKNEAQNFKEWIEYHRIIGVDKFYIYDNESTDNTKEILQPYIKAGIVEYVFMPGEKMQLAAYRHFIKNFKFETQWAATIDLDEFIVSKKEPLLSFLQKQKNNIAQILVPWVFFGSNGHISKPDGLVIENYTKRAKRAKMYKSIFKPCLTMDVAVHKHFVAGKIIFPNMKNIMVNHYYCKSWQEYQKRATRGDAFRGKQFAQTTFTRDKFNQCDINDVTDTFILRYADEIKKRI